MVSEIEPEWVHIIVEPFDSQDHVYSYFNEKGMTYSSRSTQSWKSNRLETTIIYEILDIPEEDLLYIKLVYPGIVITKKKYR
jgi:hypothetical protein